LAVNYVGDAGDLDGDGCDDLVLSDGDDVFIHYSTQCGDSVDSDGDGFDTDHDCDDTDATVYPGATDGIADGQDQDCDGKETCYIDDDGDGYRLNNDTGESYDVTCTLFGFAPVGLPLGDCDDGDANVFPGAAEVVGDGVDQDCDGEELCYVDADEDGWRTELTAPSSNLTCDGRGEASPSIRNGDCDDSDGLMNPGVHEGVGDGVDANCDGMELCYVDADNDGVAVGKEPAISADLDCDDFGEAGADAALDDCDDQDSTIFPGATERIGDEVDSNCDGLELCYVDLDGDGWRGDETRVSEDADCADAPEVTAGAWAGDCDDRLVSVFPGAVEVPANGRDEDCDGAELCYTDADSDGFTRAGWTLSGDLDCDDAGEASKPSDVMDCDDGDAAIHPGADETVADEIDADCDGSEICLVDVDGDGFPALDETQISVDADCDDVTESAATGVEVDCDDLAPHRYPGAFDIPGDAVDQDCDGQDAPRESSACSALGGPPTVLWGLLVLPIAFRRRPNLRR
ncbi:MAG: putative metal-binding motif-containing protein, partial [Myxococcota bacterium]